MDKITIEIEVDKTDGLISYKATVKEMPDCYVENSDLQGCLVSISEMITMWEDMSDADSYLEDR